MKKIFSVLIIFLASVNASPGQLLTNNGAAMDIYGGVQMTVKGDIQNNAGSTINNWGTIDFTGDWTHNASNNCFGTSAGIVILNGADQSIGGTNNTVFNNVQLAGSGIKTLLTDVTVGGGNATPIGVLALDNLHLDLNSNELTLSHRSGFAVTRTTGFIQSETDPLSGYGSVKWNIGNSPAGSIFEFPFGNLSTSDYLPFRFTITSTGSNDGYVRVSTYPTDPGANPNNRPLPTGLPVLINTSGIENAPNVIDRWWNVTTEDFITNPTANMRFSYRESEWLGGTNTITEGLLLAQHFDGSAWSYPPTGTVNPAANEVTVFSVNNFNSIWTLVGSNSPLPVELLFFTAIPVGNKKVKCSWSTATEINNDYFAVERSREGVNFEEIGIVDGSGNSTTELYYSFDDNDPYEGTSYYRLRQVDFDGRFTYSQTVAVKITNAKGMNAILFPNPAADQVYLQLSSSFADPSAAVFQIHDAVGRVVFQEALTKLSPVADNLFKIGRGNIAPGMYFCRIFSGEELLMKGKIEFQ